MSPKERTRQPTRKRPLPAPEVVVRRLPEGRFWVSITDPENCRNLVAGQSLTLDDDGMDVAVLRGTAWLGLLESDGKTWVRTHGFSSCAFVRYDEEPARRFEVSIVAE